MKTMYSPDSSFGAGPIASPEDVLAYNAATKADVSKTATVDAVDASGRRLTLKEFLQRVEVSKSADRNGTLTNMDEYESLAGSNDIFDSLGIFSDIADMQRADVEKSAEHEAEILSDDAWLFDSCFPPVVGVS